MNLVGLFRRVAAPVIGPSCHADSDTRVTFGWHNFEHQHLLYLAPHDRCLMVRSSFPEPLIFGLMELMRSWRLVTFWVWALNPERRYIAVLGLNGAPTFTCRVQNSTRGTRIRCGRTTSSATTTLQRRTMLGISKFLRDPLQQPFLGLGVGQDDRDLDLA